MYLSLHAYVEYVALQGLRPLALDRHQEFLPEELLPAYSGAHLGGGTDPSLGWRSRLASRAAWIAQNLDTGGVVPGSSGRSRDYAVPDSAWLEAERLLSFAMSRADSSCSRQAKLELLALLGDIRGRLAGPRGLTEARRAYQQLVTLAAGGTSASDSCRWLGAESRLAEIESRIAAELLATKGDPDAHRKYSENARVRLGAAIDQITGSEVLNPEKSQVNRLEGSNTDKSRPSIVKRTSWFGLAAPVDGQTPEDAGVPASEQQGPRLTSLPVPLQRAVVSAKASLASLEAGAGQLDAAYSTLASTKRSIELALTDEAGLPQVTLHQAWLRSRLAMICSSQAEVAYAMTAYKGTSAEREAQAHSILREAYAASQSALAEAQAAPESVHTLPKVDIRRTAVLSGVNSLRTRGILAEIAAIDLESALQHYEEALALLSSGADSTNIINMESRSRLLSDVRRCREKLELRQEQGKTKLCSIS